VKSKEIAKLVLIIVWMVVPLVITLAKQDMAYLNGALFSISMVLLLKLLNGET